MFNTHGLEEVTLAEAGDLPAGSNVIASAGNWLAVTMRHGFAGRAPKWGVVGKVHADELCADLFDRDDNAGQATLFTSSHSLESRVGEELEDLLASADDIQVGSVLISGDGKGNPNFVQYEVAILFDAAGGTGTERRAVTHPTVNTMGS
ncbi:hypothetical protein [Plantibacter sp. YIM 135249]|uniref:hypothetical protein n=1 Tax=Plantibacter sp. YIM 135249 TaxID=3423918 RepID=UPI003D3384FA